MDALRDRGPASEDRLRREGRSSVAAAVISPPTSAQHIEFYSWHFFRLSGVLLVLLALGHFAIVHVFNSILDVDYRFVARRWALPAWRVYDWLLLALALAHGFNGLRVVVEDYVKPGRWRGVARWLLAISTLGFLTLGTYVVIAFQPRAP